jgi:hypothetical protein
VGVVACMEQRDIVQMLASNLALLRSIFEGTEKPTEKKAAWEAAQQKWVSLQQMNGAEGSLEWNQAKSNYEAISTAYQAWCKNSVWRWTPSQSSLARSAFAQMSREFPLKETLPGARCEGTMALSFGDDVACAKNTMLGGIICHGTPHLQFGSCLGENWGLLRGAKTIYGQGADETAARQDLDAQFQQSGILQSWKNQLEEWRPQCAQ